MALKNRTIKIVIFLTLAFCVGAGVYLYLKPASMLDSPQASMPDSSKSDVAKPTDSIPKPVERQEIKDIKISVKKLVANIDQKLSESGIDPAKLLKTDEEELRHRKAEMSQLRARLQEIKENQSN